MLQLPNPQAENVKKKYFGDQNSKLLIFDKNQWSYLQNHYNLTPREQEIAELICQGLKENNIARNLNIGTGTVKTHIRNICRKVRVKSKLAMLLRFISDIRELSTY